MPDAARIGDMHICPKSTGTVPHVGGPVSQGEQSVLIGGAPAARKGDQLVCSGPPDVIVQGEPSVLIGGKPAARLSDLTDHGGVISSGCPTVLIGKPVEGNCYSEASKTGAPFINMEMA